jgi:putative polyhydroxyalkanoate system protein
MAVIDIQRPVTLGRSEARLAIEGLVESLAGRFGLSHRDDGERIVFSRPGVRGHVIIGEGRVQVRAELGLLFGGMKPLIEREIGQTLDRIFGPAAPG